MNKFRIYMFSSRLKMKSKFCLKLRFFRKTQQQSCSHKTYSILPLHGFAKKKLIIFVKHKSDMTISHSCNLDFLKLFLIGVNRTNKIC